MCPEKRRVIVWPDPILEQSAKPVDHGERALVASTLAELHSWMISTGSSALAANQLGIPLRIIALRCPQAGTGNPPKFIDLINPEITKKSGQDRTEETCLSLPGAQLGITRFERIQVTALTSTFDQMTFVASGRFARAIQHSVDHLDGIMMIDRCSRLLAKTVLRNIHMFTD